ncbi:protein ENHANCED DISEASE RESISTANCE 4 [Magnolia sinica]|uniref:protein ENHANCED DISEASE RESISTANCE 4 n=1 Tax=Magnolia sinica TaxID=86752 RepID=UPI002657C893|nr:protein ENHANCED DISEASE RESISTANCE 4 [Magnolia sinica]
MASNVPNIRFVRCPKCRKVLIELPDLPVYRCGGCDVVLQAKKRGESSRSRTAETNRVQNNEAEHASNSNESIALSQQLTACSTDAYVSDADHPRELAVSGNADVRNPNAVSSSGELDSHTSNGESAKTARNGEESNVNEMKDTNFESPKSNVESQIVTGNSTLDEQAEKPQPLDQCIRDRISPRENKEVREEPIHRSTISDDTVITKLGGSLGNLSKSPTRSSHAYDASVSSCGDGTDDHVPDRHPNSSNRILFESQTGVDSIGTGKINADLEIQCQVTNLSAMSLNEYGSATTGGIAWNQDNPSKSARYGLQAPEQGSVQESDVFHSVNSWMESERDGSYRYPPSRDSGHGWGPPSIYQNGGPSNYQHEELPNSPNSYSSNKLNYLEKDRIELLKKVEELKDELSRSYGQRRKGKEKVPIRGVHLENQWPSGYDHHRLPYYNTSYHQNPHQPYIQRKTMPHQFGPSQTQFTIRQPTSCSLHVEHSCPHCYHKDWQFHAHPPPSAYRSQGLCQACPSHTCYHSCNPSSSHPQLHPDSSFLPHHHNPHPHEPRLVEHEMEKLQRKERRQPTKRHCLPLAGGAPFVICNRCWKLLQLPADFMLSTRRRHKLQCGACSKVLAFSHNGKNRTSSYVLTQEHRKWSEASDIISSATMNAASTSGVDGFVHGDPISYSDDYGLSVSKSYSTEGEPVFLAPPIHPHRSSWNDRNHAESSSLKPRTQGRKKRVIAEQSEKEPEHSNKVSESEEANMEMSPLHMLMGYSSVSEVLYGPRFLRRGSQSRNIENTVTNGSLENSVVSPLQDASEEEVSSKLSSRNARLQTSLVS